MASDSSSKSGVAAGGTGAVFDWDVAEVQFAWSHKTHTPLHRHSVAATFLVFFGKDSSPLALQKVTEHFPVLVAGGLHPGNVQEAIRHMKPWAVVLFTGAVGC